MEKFNSVVLRFALFAAVTIHLCDMPAVGRQGNALPADKEFTNSIGMKFVRVEPGRFRMGSEDADLPPEVLVANEADGVWSLHRSVVRRWPDLDEISSCNRWRTTGRIPHDRPWDIRAQRHNR